MPRPRHLAAHWAPVIVQDLEWGAYRQGYLTRFDYDGDWNGANNLANAIEFDLPAYVYYWIAESSTHVFVGYGLYHVGGAYQGDGYENDMHGLVVVVDRAFSRDNPMGRFVALITAAQGTVRVAAERDPDVAEPGLAAVWQPRTAPSRGLKGKDGNVLHDVNFVIDTEGFHPVVYADALGAALATSAGGGERPATFAQSPVTDWSRREWDYEAGRELSHGRGRDTDGSGDGVVFGFRGDAQVSMPAGVKGKGRFPHAWQVIGYDLLPLDELWQRQEDNSGRRLTFADHGVFTGDGPRGPGARAPWGWTGPAGDVFHAPGELLERLVKGLDGFSAAVVTGNLE